jgi:dihydrofolate reductase
VAPTISIIAAIGKNRELGKNNKLLWQLKKDLQHFKIITSGHPVIMGRKTFESIGFPLPKRTNIVITRDKNYQVAAGVIICDSLEKAMEVAKTKDRQEIFIIGGASIYSQAINLADKLYLTLVDGTFDADVYFPEYSRFNKIISSKEDSEGKYKFKYLELMPK